jgi:hypothetical protein
MKPALVPSLRVSARIRREKRVKGECGFELVVIFNSILK